MSGIMTRNMNMISAPVDGNPMGIYTYQENEEDTGYAFIAYLL